jgi:hypothetical protein
MLFLRDNRENLNIDKNMGIGLGNIMKAGVIGYRPC